jgi:phosphoribosylaminoimidazole (AIR) synthetase
MYRVFNMGLGMVAVCPENNVSQVLEILPDAMIIGNVVLRSDGEPVVYNKKENG